MWIINGMLGGRGSLEILGSDDNEVNIIMVIGLDIVGDGLTRIIVAGWWLVNVECKCDAVNISFWCEWNNSKSMVLSVEWVSMKSMISSILVSGYDRPIMVMME